ncbi:MAG: L-threonylcarbamoyladenylate synthase [Patescibacteria group bacterium]
MLLFRSFRSPRLIERLVKGGIGVIPTDTVYGIVASAKNPGAVSRLTGIRGRDPKSPYLILIGSRDDLENFSIRLTPRQEVLLDEVWPGPVSVVLPCRSQKYAYLNHGAPTLAFRLPRPAALRAFLNKTGPLIAPSANPVGLPCAKSVLEAKKYFGHGIDCAVDGGERVGKPSRLIDLTGDTIRVLRP